MTLGIFPYPCFSPSGTCAVACTMLYSFLELVLFSVNRMTFRNLQWLLSSMITVQLPGQPLPLSSWEPGFFLPTTQLQPVFFKGILVPLLPSAPQRPANSCYFTFRSQFLNCIKAYCMWIPVASSAGNKLVNPWCLLESLLKSHRRALGHLHTCAFPAKRLPLELVSW